MASLKKLVGQTMWYGVSNIAARLLTSLLTPYLTYTLVGAAGKEEFGKFSFIYLLFPFLNVLYTYGMETAYFRYSTEKVKRERLYGVQMTAMLISTLAFTVFLILFQQPLAEFAEIADRPNYVLWCALILGIDAFTTLPFAKLRSDERPRRYAFIRIAGIITYVTTIVFLFSFGGKIFGDSSWFKQHWGLGFILFANILQCVVNVILLAPEWFPIRLRFDKVLLHRVLAYGFPILIAGFAGTINDTLNRVMFMKLNPMPADENLRLLGVFTASVRLAVLISLAVQAFKMAAEPYFFSISKERGARRSYARIMKWFFIVLAVMFLNIILFMDLWKYFVGPEYRDALQLVPILLIANIALGVYYNLTVWYKLTDKTMYGAYIMMIGAAVTIVFNFFFIEPMGYEACAWSMLLSNLVMMVLSYLMGQKHYKIPYNLKRMGLYTFVMLLFAGVQIYFSQQVTSVPLHLLLGAGLFVLFLMLVFRMERKEFADLLHRKKRIAISRQKWAYPVQTDGDDAKHVCTAVENFLPCSVHRKKDSL